MEKQDQSNRAPTPEEEPYYEEALNEMNSGIRRPGIYAKALADSLGDKKKVDSLYLEYRAQSLKEEAEKIAEEKRVAEEKIAEEERVVEEERVAEEERIAEGKARRIAEEERIAEEKARRIAEEEEAKRIAEEERLQQIGPLEEKYAEEKRKNTSRAFKQGIWIPIIVVVLIYLISLIIK